MKFDSKCHLSTKLFAEHSKIASQPINWKVNKCHFVVLVVNKCHFVVLVVNKCHFVVLVVNKCHFVVLVVRKRSRNDFTLLKRVLKLCNNVANYGTKVFLWCLYCCYYCFLGSISLVGIFSQFLRYMTLAYSYHHHHFGTLYYFSFPSFLTKSIFSSLNYSVWKGVK